MPMCSSSIHGMPRDLVLDLGDDDPERDMRSFDRRQRDAVCRHLVGDLPATGTLRAEEPR